jgi:hypothetical protein
MLLWFVKRLDRHLFGIISGFLPGGWIQGLGLLRTRQGGAARGGGQALIRSVRHEVARGEWLRRLEDQLMMVT